MFQLVDQSDERLHVWTGGAASALQYRNHLQQAGRTVVVADQRGRRLSPSDLAEIAALENERQAAASLKAFWQLQTRRT